MPRKLLDTLDNWANGILTSVRPDGSFDAFSPRGKNTTLVDIGPQTARIAKRKGVSLINSTPVSGSPQILGGFQYKKRAGTKFNLLVSSTGRLDSVDAAGALTTINATAFTTGAAHIPNFAVANDLCFIFNDIESKKFNGTGTETVGIARPAAPGATAVAAGVNGMLGVYDFATSYFNSATGHESSRSDFTAVTIGANQRASLTWLASADTQVTHVMVHIRKAAIGPTVYRLIVQLTPGVDATYGGFAVATTAALADVADASFASMITISPSTTENNQPTAGWQYPVWHNQRLFLADSGNLYYSNIKNGSPKPEAFHPNNIQPVNPDDGDIIVGMYSTHGVLYVFKKLSIWKLDGTDPSSWTVSNVSHDYGSSSHRSAIDIEGTLYWYSGTNGPVSKTADGSISPHGKTLLANTIKDTVLNQLSLQTVVVGQLEGAQEVLWAVPEIGQTRHTLILPFNYRLQKFSSDGWTIMDCSSLWTVETADQLKALYFGGYSGQAFKFSATSGNDGVGSGTKSGTVGSTTGATSLVDLTATFLTAGGGLIERYVYAISSDGLNIQRRRITANTATALTVTPAWTTTPNNTYTYVVGGIDWQVDTPWVVSASGFLKKKNEFLYLEVTSSDSGTVLMVDMFKNMDDLTPKRTKTVTLNSAGGIYDPDEGVAAATDSLYDDAVYGSSSGMATFAELRCAFTSKVWKARLRNIQVDHDLSVYRLAMESVGLGFLSS